MLLEEALTEYIFTCKIRRLSDKTISNYQKQIMYWNRYYTEICQITEVESIKPIHVKNFIRMKQNDHLKASYINDLLKAERSFFNYLVDEGYVSVSPLKGIRDLKQPKVVIQTFTADEIKRMLQFYSHSTFLDIRNRAILATFFDTGIRCGELMNLKDSEIKDDCIVVIHGKGDKERYVSKSPYLSKCLMRYQRAKDGYFLHKFTPAPYTFVSRTGKQLTHEAVVTIVKEAAKAVKVDESVRASPHTCRHTFAQIQLKNGTDLYSLSRLMGHENIAITQRYLRGLKNEDVIHEGIKNSILSNIAF